MKYQKPEIVAEKHALARIQGNPPNSKMGGPSDHVLQVTSSAYEADE